MTENQYSEDNWTNFLHSCLVGDICLKEMRLVPANGNTIMVDLSLGAFFAFERPTERGLYLECLDNMPLAIWTDLGRWEFWRRFQTITPDQDALSRLIPRLGLDNPMKGGPEKRRVIYEVHHADSVDLPIPSLRSRVRNVHGYAQADRSFEAMVARYHQMYHQK